jgi:hypothetical protein
MFVSHVSCLSYQLASYTVSACMSYEYLDYAYRFWFPKAKLKDRIEPKKKKKWLKLLNTITDKINKQFDQQN